MLPEGDGGCGQSQEGGDAQPDALAQAVGHIIGGEPEEQAVPADASCSQQVALTKVSIKCSFLIRHI